MKKKQANLKCGVCGETKAYPVSISKVFGRGEKEVLIEDIPAFNREMIKLFAQSRAKYSKPALYAVRS